MKLDSVMDSMVLAQCVADVNCPIFSVQIYYVSLE